ncbi:DUF1249 domain-containing protein [uncultured Ferrimonas sp.]|uniref:DUF1249 domain-containing protein n=1 Tax=uncultured Ferrimonas sp. TaxID=432640 RepID=UPI00260EAF63|nr:DUF1249 domain-containing protein [uncultured Ferrimonas sp.]
MSPAKRRYAPSLAKLLALCGRNYRVLQQLLTDGRHQQGPQRHYRWQHRRQGKGLALQLCEQTKYTELVQLSHWDDAISQVVLPVIELRIYHDAQLAEVLTGQHFSRLLPVYPYPNAAMLQRDEKFQVNLFVAELLGQHGQHDWQLMTMQESRKS